MNGLLDSSLLDNFTLNGSGGSNIKSIQAVESTYVSATTKSITINPVDITKAIIIPCLPTQQTNINTEPSFFLHDSTTVRLASNVASAISQVVMFYVVEFNNVKSLQTGTASASSTLTNVTVSTVNPLKCLALATAAANYSSIDKLPVYGIVTSPTNLKLVSGLNFTQSILWTLIEFL